MNELRIYPDPALRDKARKVENFDYERLTYITKIMQKILEKHEAVGIAAPQLGILEQIVMVNSGACNTGKGTGFSVLINPQIIDRKGGETLEEGCLSIPGVEIPVGRANFVIVSGFECGVFWEEKIIEAADLLARVLQHEIDHLNGVLIIDKLQAKERLEFNMKWKRGEYEKRHPSKVL